MNERSRGSVTGWVAQLKAGDDEAARQLWERYFERLTRIAKQKLGNACRRVSDEEDVALSVFNSLCQGAAKGHFPQLVDRNDLWRLLHAITKQKAVDQIRRNVRQKRGGGEVRGESAFLKRPLSDHDSDVGGINAVAADDLTPEFVVSMNEQLQRLLDALPDDSLRQVAVRSLEGETTDEIAERLGMTTRSIQRKLKLIREDWSVQKLS